MTHRASKTKILPVQNQQPSSVYIAIMLEQQQQQRQFQKYSTVGLLTKQTISVMIVDVLCWWEINMNAVDE